MSSDGTQLWPGQDEELFAVQVRSDAKGSRLANGPHALRLGCFHHMAKSIALDLFATSVLVLLQRYGYFVRLR